MSRKGKLRAWAEKDKGMIWYEREVEKKYRKGQGKEMARKGSRTHGQEMTMTRDGKKGEVENIDKNCQGQGKARKGQ